MIFQLHQNRLVLQIVFLIVAAAAGASQLPAQDPASPLITPDTGTAEGGRRDGRVAAEKPRMDRRATTGFVGGLAFGTLGAILFREEPLGFIGLVPGLALIGAAWRLGDNRPPPESISGRGDTYVQAYSDSYRKRLLERRRNAAILGGAAGTVAGLGTLFVLYLVISTGYD